MKVKTEHVLYAKVASMDKYLDDAVGYLSDPKLVEGWLVEKNPKLLQVAISHLALTALLHVKEELAELIVDVDG